MGSQVTIATMLVTWAVVELATRLVMETTPPMMPIISREVSIVARMGTKSVQRVDILLIRVARSKWLETSRSRATTSIISIRLRRQTRPHKIKISSRFNMLPWTQTTTSINWKMKKIEFIATTWIIFNSSAKRNVNSSKTTKKIPELLRTNIIKTTKTTRIVMMVVPEETPNLSLKTRREAHSSPTTKIKQAPYLRVQQLHLKLLRLLLERATKKCQLSIDWNKYRIFSSRRGPESVLNLREDLVLAQSATKRDILWNLSNLLKRKKGRSASKEYFRSFIILKMTIFRSCFQVAKIGSLEQPKTSLIKTANSTFLKLLFSNTLRATKIKLRVASMKT